MSLGKLQVTATHFNADKTYTPAEIYIFAEHDDTSKDVDVAEVASEWEFDDIWPKDSDGHPDPNEKSKYTSWAKVVHGTGKAPNGVNGSVHGTSWKVGWVKLMREERDNLGNITTHKNYSKIIKITPKPPIER